jgi:hypothetical protein
MGQILLGISQDSEFQKLNRYPPSLNIIYLKDRLVAAFGFSAVM